VFLQAWKTSASLASHSSFTEVDCCCPLSTDLTDTSALVTLLRKLHVSIAASLGCRYALAVAAAVNKIKKTRIINVESGIFSRTVFSSYSFDRPFHVLI
jgi:hypothetical protein